MSFLFNVAPRPQVLIWNQLACGDAELCAIVVAFNSMASVVLYAPLAVFYLQARLMPESAPDEPGNGTRFNACETAGGVQDVPAGLRAAHHLLAGAGTAHAARIASVPQIRETQVLRTVLIFLAAPLVVGFTLRMALLRLRGLDWLEKRFLPAFGPLALVALLYTIFVMFALQGRRVLHEIGDVCRVAVPMVMYFSVMWFGSFALCLRARVPYAAACVHSFTASSNNFELAIAIAVGTFGIDSKEALAATIGPLIEVPVLLGLVHVALWLGRRFDFAQPGEGRYAAAPEAGAAALEKGGQERIATKL